MDSANRQLGNTEEGLAMIESRPLRIDMGYKTRNANPLA